MPVKNQIARNFYAAVHPAGIIGVDAAVVVLAAFLITAQIIVVVAVLLHRCVNIGAGNRDPRHGVRVFFLRGGKAFVRRLDTLCLCPRWQHRTAVAGTPEKQEPGQQQPHQNKNNDEPQQIGIGGITEVLEFFSHCGTSATSSSCHGRRGRGA